jgi:hypothetical protein
MHVETQKHSAGKGRNSQILKCKISMEIGLKMSQRYLKKRNWLEKKIKVAKKRNSWEKNACGNTKTLIRQRKELSDIEMQDLNGNWTQDEPEVPKKVNLINLRAYQCQSVSQI